MNILDAYHIYHRHIGYNFSPVLVLHFSLLFFCICQLPDNAFLIITYLHSIIHASYLSSIFSHFSKNSFTVISINISHRATYLIVNVVHRGGTPAWIKLMHS